MQEINIASRLHLRVYKRFFSNKPLVNGLSPKYPNSQRLLYEQNIKIIDSVMKLFNLFYDYRFNNKIQQGLQCLFFANRYNSVQSYCSFTYLPIYRYRSLTWNTSSSFSLAWPSCYQRVYEIQLSKSKVTCII